MSKFSKDQLVAVNGIVAKVLWALDPSNPNDANESVSYKLGHGGFNMNEAFFVAAEADMVAHDMRTELREPHEQTNRGSNDRPGVHCAGCTGYGCPGVYDDEPHEQGTDEREWDDSNMGGVDRFGG